MRLLSLRHLALFAVSAAMGLAATSALALDQLPVKDLPKFSDLANVKRFADSVLVYRDDVAFDEVTFPTGKVSYANDRLTASKSVRRTGQRAMLVYIAPAGRSPLEVLRNYQNDLKAGGFAPLFECAEDACGEATALTGANNFNFANMMFRDNVYNAPRSAAHACAAGAEISGFRYALMENAAIGETLAVMTWRPLVKGYALPCPDEIEKNTSVLVFRVQARAMEQKMATVTASEISQSLTATGKVALYGILFDSGKADIRPESKASLDEIGKLLKGDARLKLHVVGHTDNNGGLESNFDLSKRRAAAVKDALTQQFGVAGDRLTANGVSSLAPVSTNATDAGRAKNRRVELVLF
ncbi:MAG: DUF4892 domain-containing protein [Microbacteriaceae bacterium]|nr:DUF4892 domain-containing protein [Burkholderiaceae bacterium]